MGFQHVGQAGLELLTADDPLASASQSAGNTGVHHTMPGLLTAFMYRYFSEYLLFVYLYTVYICEYFYVELFSDFHMIKSTNKILFF